MDLASSTWFRKKYRLQVQNSILIEISSSSKEETCYLRILNCNWEYNLPLKNLKIKNKERKIVYLLDCATRSISFRFAMATLFMSLFAAKTSSSARVSWMLRGLLAEEALAPSVICRIARSILRWGATSTDRW